MAFRWHAIALMTVGQVLLGSCLMSPEEPVLQRENSSDHAPGKGELEGQVLFDGSQAPGATLVQNTTDPQHCGEIQSLQDVIISPENRGIQNVIVGLKDASLPKEPKPAPGRLVLDNRECQFVPHAAVLTTGSILEAVNSDPIFHSVHLYGPRNINLGLGPASSKPVRTLARPGLLIIKCDVHGWMKAFIRVDEHPYHAVTDAKGRFRIEAVPAGMHTVEFWHEYFGSGELQVPVKPDASSKLIFRYASKVSKGG